MPEEPILSNQTTRVLVELLAALRANTPSHDGADPHPGCDVCSLAHTLYHTILHHAPPNAFRLYDFTRSPTQPPHK